MSDPTPASATTTSTPAHRPGEARIKPEYVFYNKQIR